MSSSKWHRKTMKLTDLGIWQAYVDGYKKVKDLKGMGLPRAFGIVTAMGDLGPQIPRIASCQRQ